MGYSYSECDDRRVKHRQSEIETGRDRHGQIYRQTTVKTDGNKTKNSQKHIKISNYFHLHIYTGDFMKKVPTATCALMDR